MTMTASNPMASYRPAPYTSDICEWAESRMTVAASARPGLLQLDAYQREPLRAMVEREVKQVSLMWSTQLGKSLMDCVRILYSIDTAPEPILIMHASRAGLLKFNREKLNPALLNNPEINAKVGRSTPHSLGAEGFPYEGGYVTLATPRAMSGQHGTSASLVIGDEVDDYGPGWDSLSLQQRTSTHPDATIVLSSTPSRPELSPIVAEYESGSQEWYYTRCPHCGDCQLLLRERVTDDGRMACIGCGVLWSEQDRIQAIRMGAWVPQAPGDGHRSFWLSQLYSTVVPLPDTMKTVNAAKFSQGELSRQVLAWPYAEIEIPAIDPDRIARVVPDWAAAYRTCGVDVQGDRLEWYVVEFDETLARQHVRAMGVIPRTPDELTHWLNLRRAVAAHAPMRITIDGGYQFDLVQGGLHHAFPDVMGLPDSPVEIVRGRAGDSFDKPLRGQNRSGYFFGSTDEAKVLIARALVTGTMTLDPGLPSYVEQQLASEELIKQEGPRGAVKRAWVKKSGVRNEALDCVGYALMGAVAAYVENAGGDSPALVLG